MRRGIWKSGLLSELLQSDLDSFASTNDACLGRWRRLSSTFVVLVSVLCLAIPSIARAQLTRQQTILITNGSQVFNNQTSNGNGRTCGTCHVPQFDYNLTPSNFAALTQQQLNLVLATHNPQLENPTLVNKLAMFNINNGQPAQSGTGTTPNGPFRTSMALGGFKFTTLDMCENSGVISTITSDSTGLATVTMTEPIELFAGESFRILATGTGFDTTDPPIPQVIELVSPTTQSGVPSSTQFTF